MKTERDDFLVAVLLADFVQDFQARNNDKPILRIDALADARYNGIGYPLAGLLQYNLARNVAQYVETELMQIAPSRPDAE